MARSYVHEARRRVGPKRVRIHPVIERLAAEHPDAVIALRFLNDLELLVSVLLSAQTTDVTVNRVTATLFQKYRRPEDYLAVPLGELEADVRPTGTFRQKARNLRGAMRMLLEEYGGDVPLRLEELVRLPGVGRKTANVVSDDASGFAYKPGARATAISALLGKAAKAASATTVETSSLAAAAFVRYPDAPAAAARRTSSSEGEAVRITIAVSGASSLIRRVASMPSISGI